MRRSADLVRGGRWVLPGAAVLVCCGASAQLPAGAAEETAAVAEEIVVTARRREEALTDIPSGITVLDETSLRERGLTELNQLEKFAPNVVQTNFGQGNTSHAAVFIRGIGLQDHIITTDPAVGIYLDGVYLGRNMGANMDLMNIERVEVLRGPQGSLSGRNTLGGALNIVTRKPAGDDAARIDFRVGSRNRLNGNVFADMALADALSLSVSGGIKSRDGVGRAVRIANPEAEIGQIFQGFGRAALLWDAADELRFLVTADISRSDQGVTPHAVEVFNPDNGFGLRQADQPLNPDDTFSLNNELMSTEDEVRGVLPDRRLGRRRRAEPEGHPRLSGHVVRGRSGQRKSPGDAHRVPRARRGRSAHAGSAARRHGRLGRLGGRPLLFR